MYDELVPDVPRATQDIHSALIDLMTDDEPSESNLAYHFATDEDFRVSVCEQAFARLSDSPEHPWEVGAWLEAGHADCGQIADMSQKGGDCVRSGGENVRECQPMRDLADECAELERIVDRLTAERDGLQRAAERDADVMECLNDELANMTGSRDHWRRVAGKHAKEMQTLRRALKLEQERTVNELPEGVVWPRYTDGRPVRVGDEFANGRGETHTVDALVFNKHNSPDCLIHYGNDYEIHGRDYPVEYPPLKAHDGKPIEVGQVYFGLSDGKAWEVEGFDRKRKWSVWAHDVENPEKRKCLKPEWLSRERPDSFNAIAGELREFVDTHLISMGNGMYEEYDELTELAERIEKLAKEGGASCL